MKTFQHPVERLKGKISSIFHLKKKGRKLLDIGFALLGAVLGTLTLQVAVLLLCEVKTGLWWKAIIPWIPILVWGWWRYFFRYLHARAFVCDHCGRIKCPSALSAESKISGKKVCQRCEERNEKMGRRIEEMQKGLSSLAEGIKFLKKFPPPEEDPEKKIN